jgi:hypothetical protein
MNTLQAIKEAVEKFERGELPEKHDLSVAINTFPDVDAVRPLRDGFEAALRATAKANAGQRWWPSSSANCASSVVGSDGSCANAGLASVAACVAALGAGGMRKAARPLGRETAPTANRRQRSSGRWHELSRRLSGGAATWQMAVNNDCLVAARRANGPDGDAVRADVRDAGFPSDADLAYAEQIASEGR